ncbi:hypothetical protein J5N97_011751 [Dioscorea zingiberensis]|uniref:Uncharacterized protein n=1 Tax=Dioscorea zingiberensis TaxID=325984 RepID=A0A9D5D124_9LILI|nr:hypothetical protein J5N97_011751 [Dioscorea zingiberensis]
MLRYVMSVSGKLQQFIWVESEKEWLLFWSQPKPQCDVYNLCGDNGVCCNEELTKYCQCLPGFEPGSMAEWQNDVTKGGCIRKTGLNCGSNGTDPDRFRLIPRIKFPVAVDAKLLNASSRGECESSCLRSCSCTAYTFIAGACRLWYGNLKNTRVMENDTDGTGGDLYLRLSASEFGLDSSPGFSTWMILVIVAASSVLCSLVLVSCICYCLRRRKERVRTRQEKSILTWGAEIASKLREQGATGPDFTLFGFSCIKDATDNFSDEYKLGEGGFGPVYKGKLPEGREVAVKRLSTRSGQGLEEFKNEIVLIAKLQHRNLVRLLGCCIQGEEKILVYEYMLNKSLDFFLFEPTRGAQLDWSRRFHIVKGIAQGLLYLHKHSRLRIIHRDLKASNILLDDEMSPKISDFGLARIFGSDETQANTNRAWDLWSDGSWLELVDPVINDDTLHALELHRCIHVALLCVQDSACHRPTMSEVIALLGNENDSVSLTAPKKPVFFSVSIATQTGDVKSSPSFSNAKQTCSLNHLSLTTMHAR